MGSPPSKITCLASLHTPSGTRNRREIGDELLSHEYEMVRDGEKGDSGINQEKNENRTPILGSLVKAIVKGLGGAAAKGDPGSAGKPAETLTTTIKKALDNAKGGI